MKKFSLLLLSFFAISRLLVAQTQLPAIIDSNITLTTSYSPYILNQNALVVENTTVIIEPGVIIKTDPNTSKDLLVQGELIAIGNKNNPILISKGYRTQDDLFDMRLKKEAIENMKQDFEMQTRGLVELQSRNQEIQLEMNRYLDIFKRHNVEISPDNILIVPGGKVIIFFSSMLLGDHNREILYPNPGFPIYESAIRFSGAKPVPYHLKENIGFSFSADDILNKLNKKTSLIIINSPSNPTGGIIPKEEIDKLIEGLEKHPNIMLMSDEIYDQFCFGETRFTSLLNYPSIRDRLIILNGWSKTYAMTGWRLGYGVFPDTLIDAADKLAVNVHSCVNASAQYAALEALNGPQDCVTMMNNAFKKRSKIMFEQLNKLDLKNFLKII